MTDERGDRRLSTRRIVAGLVVLVAVMGTAGYLVLSRPGLFDNAPRPIIDAHMQMFSWNVYGDPPEANLVTGALFLAAMFVSPLASVVPTEVAAAALVVSRFVPVED